MSGVTFHYQEEGLDEKQSETREEIEKKYKKRKIEKEKKRIVFNKHVCK